MSKPTKTFLALCLITSAVAFIPATSSLAWGIFKPMGAIFFILFFIFKVMDRETARFDAEQARLDSSRQRQAPGTVSSEKPRDDRRVHHGVPAHSA